MDLKARISNLFCLAAFLLPPTVLSGAERELEPARRISGSLFIHGGGGTPKGIMEEFIRICDQSGGLVVIPTAADDGQIDEEKIVERWNGRGFESVTVLHTRSRDEAGNEEFVKPLSTAKTVWISGGQQARLEKAYVGTRVEKELHALLDRGGVVGGSSAGAAVMSRVMIRSGNPTAEVGKGFGLIGGAVIDQHFLKRKRQPRLRKVLADHPGLVGYGVAEGTALILQGRKLRVVGESTVTVCLDKSTTLEEAWSGLGAGSIADHIAMSRAAIARAAEDPFPPAKPVATNVPKGTVVAFGGGGTTRGGLERFVAAAGGKDAKFVSIYTAQSDKPELHPRWKRMWDSVGVENVKALHASDLGEANSDAFVKEIDAADGIWFGGGRQWRLVDRYAGTATHAALRRVLERGGVVGGSSAGATIVGDYLVRGDPLTSRTMMQEGYEQGLGFVPGVAIDQHFAQRKRFGDMVALKKRYPQLLGIGIDEGTAIAFHGGEGEVYGPGKVYLYPVEGERVELEAGDRYDFQKNKHTRSKAAEGELPPAG